MPVDTDGGLEPRTLSTNRLSQHRIYAIIVQGEGTHPSLFFLRFVSSYWNKSILFLFYTSFNLIFRKILSSGKRMN